MFVKYTSFQYTAAAGLDADGQRIILLDMQKPSMTVVLSCKNCTQAMIHAHLLVKFGQTLLQALGGHVVRHDHTDAFRRLGEPYVHTKGR